MEAIFSPGKHLEQQVQLCRGQQIAARKTPARVHNCSLKLRFPVARSSSCRIATLCDRSLRGDTQPRDHSH
jgi:hypothetical protein